MNLTKLHKRLTDPIKKFEKLGDCTHTANGPMIFIDNNAPVLAVGHLDWVLFQEPKMKKQFQNTLIYDCPQLDDRLGVWMILDILPKAGIKCDILLTDGEEMGQSTAQHFKPPKQYNWIMEFDRQGSDTVMYDYDDNDMRQLLREYDFEVGHGSFTDICELESLGCKGFNFGVGYHNQHTPGCYANLAETWDSFRKVQSLYKDWSDTLLEHEEYTRQPVYYNLGGINRPYTTNGMAYTRTTARRKPLTNGAERLKKKEEKKREPLFFSSILNEDDYDIERGQSQALDDIALDKCNCIYCHCTPQQQKEVRKEYEDQNFNA